MHIRYLAMAVYFVFLSGCGSQSKVEIEDNYCATEFTSNVGQPSNDLGYFGENVCLGTEKIVGRWQTDIPITFDLKADGSLLQSDINLSEHNLSARYGVSEDGKKLYLRFYQPLNTYTGVQYDEHSYSIELIKPEHFNPKCLSGMQNYGTLSPEIGIPFELNGATICKIEANPCDDISQIHDSDVYRPDKSSGNTHYYDLTNLETFEFTSKSIGITKEVGAQTMELNGTLQRYQRDGAYGFKYYFDTNTSITTHTSFIPDNFVKYDFEQYGCTAIGNISPLDTSAQIGYKHTYQYCCDLEMGYRAITYSLEDAGSGNAIFVKHITNGHDFDNKYEYTIDQNGSFVKYKLTEKSNDGLLSYETAQ